MAQQPPMSYGAPVRNSQHLPLLPPDRLFGRDSVLASIQQMLSVGTAVLLHGPAGIGKSALAATVAAPYAEMPGGVLWFDVSRDSANGLRQRVAHAYAESAGSDTIERLRAESPLVVLDGDLDEDAAREFVRSLSGVPLLLTNSSLIPGPWTPIEVTSLTTDEATALLMHRAGDVEVDISEMVQLADTLLGHPFSLVLAAHQLTAAKVKPADFLAKMPEMTAEEINRAVGVLLAAYRLLPATLQGMVLLLGASLGSGASEELLSDVGGAPVTAIRGAMRQLVLRGFASERSVYGQPYFVVHELIQTFAHALLRDKNRLDETQARHLKGIVTYVRRHFADNSREHHERLAAELSSILAAGHYAALHNHLDQLTTLTQLLVPTSAGSFVNTWGFQPELDWLNYLLEHPETASQALLALPQAVPPVTVATEAPPTPEVAELPPLVETDVPDIQEQDTMPAPPVTTLDLDLDADFDLPAASRTTLETTSEAAPGEAVPLYEEPQATTASTAPTLETDQVAFYAQELERFAANGQIEDELNALQTLARLSLEQEKVSDVLTYVDRGMKLAEETHNPQQEGQLLIVLGDLQSMLRHDAGAEVAYQEAIQALRPTESWFEIGTVLDKLGTLYIDGQRYQDTLDILQQAIPIFEREQRTDYLVGVYDKLGDAYASLLNWDDARSNHERALELARQTSDNEKIFAQLAQLALTLESMGKPDEALPYYQQALALAFDMGDREKQGYMLLSLGELLLDDTTQLNRVAQFLEGAAERLPDNLEAQRLLSRAKTRQQRLTRAGVDLLPPAASLEEYARSAVS